ncbi:MAG: Glu/Leu/Phe/Val dehydrogenase, partial [Parcubacteria group bacterium]|nr:Glu/Leu/Phe/Val dehydrogenase [Parcubacteria group bacterium]
FGSTGFGVAQAARIAAELKGLDMKKATVAIEGFGNVGGFAFKYLREMGATIVAVADREGTAYNKNGLQEDILLKLKGQKKSVKHYPNAKKLSHDSIFGLPMDILIPASVTDVINDKNKREIRAKIIVEGANIPMQESVEEWLWSKGILIVPDFVANAGGVISSYAEYRGYNPKRMFELVERKIKRTARLVLKEALRTKRNPRQIALELAIKRLSRKRGSMYV